MKTLTSMDASLLDECKAENPELNLTHLQRLTNHVGIVQHAKFAIPDYKHGYCLDDNSRALMVCGMASTIEPLRYDDLIDRYLAFIWYMQRDNGQFGNFLSFDHKFLDEYGTEDAFGRTIWSLGSLSQNANSPHVFPLVKEILDRAFPHIAELRSLRAMAYSLLGLVALRHSGQYDKDVLPTIRLLADAIHKEYTYNVDKDWQWFESIITYDNAILPYSLFRAAAMLNEERYSDVALESALFLDGVLFEDTDVLHLVGNQGWYPKGGAKSKYGQQAIEIPSLILMYQALADYTKDDRLEQRAENCFQWFHGNNYMAADLFDANTQGCRDGIDRYTINQNQGAESCIAYWQAFLYHYHKLC